MAILKTVNLDGFGKKYQGKVRDYYLIDDKRILITTDRISAFDKVLGFIPHKGQVLNQLAAFWFEKTRDIIPNHLISVPGPEVMIVKNCQAYPIEIVVRGHITGMTTTSLWYQYSQGKREIYGLKFPDGLRKNQPFSHPIITPTTRGTGPGGHDECISKEEIIKRKIVPKGVYRQMEETALALFKRGTEICRKVGLILVDPKYEFGDYHGQLMLIDEVHTPDSTRFWIAEGYRERLARGLEQESLDKDIFRLWYSKRGYRGEGMPPRMPDYYRRKVSRRYRQVYEMITGKKFVPGKKRTSQRIKNNLKNCLERR